MIYVYTVNVAFQYSNYKLKGLHSTVLHTRWNLCTYDYKTTLSGVKHKHAAEAHIRY